jgi:hypothetical protein
MNIFLTLILCSALEGNCPQMWHKNVPYGDWSSCMNAGYIHSREFMKAIDPAVINKRQLFIKFYCGQKVMNPDQFEPQT